MDRKKKLKCALESDVARYLIKRVTEIGGIIRKVAWEGRSDAPDYLVMCGGDFAFVETKAPGKKPRPSQLREFGAMSQHGGLAVIIVSDFDEVDSLIYGIQACRHLPPAPTNP